MNPDTQLQETPLIRNGAFDSQNVAFWSATENCYIAYFRTWSKGEFAGFRTISRSTSTHFTDWTPAVPMTFGELVLNLSTGAAGGVFVEIQDTDGKPIPGYTRADALEQAGDEVERIVSWKSGTSVASLAGREIRLHFTLKDTDLYALQFRP